MYCVICDTASTPLFTDVCPDDEFAGPAANARLALLIDLVGGDIRFVKQKPITGTSSSKGQMPISLLRADRLY